MTMSENLATFGATRRTVIRGGRLLTPAGIVDDGAVVIDGGRILFAGPASAWRGNDAGAVLVDARGGWIVPGFIDLHVHGGGGGDTMDATFDALCAVARCHAQYGTTAFLATTVTAPHDRLLEVAAAVREAVGRWTGGAQVLGLHLEGPYVSPKRAGAQNTAHMRPPAPEELEELFAAAGGTWRLVTLAPELPGAVDAIRWLAERGVVVSIGHSDATYEEAAAGIAAGARHATHLFNAMRVLHHREPGVVGAALAHAEVTVELIADGEHVHPAALALAVACKGPQRTALVTDCMRARGLPDGVYKLGDLDVLVQGGKARLAASPDTIAGSLLTMGEAVRFLVRTVGVPLPEAVTMASATPARIIGVADRKGSLEPGKDGDVVVLDDDLRVQATVVAGRIVYSR